jgi:hypothetical protein
MNHKRPIVNGYYWLYGMNNLPQIVKVTCGEVWFIGSNGTLPLNDPCFDMTIIAWDGPIEPKEEK